MARGICNKHYQKYLRYGDPNISSDKFHGMSKSPEYRIWKAIKNRCLRESHRSYHRYGGRGITVCDRWKNSFTAFYEDMGQKPFPKAQIDRIDNDGNYEPENCIWTSNKENNRHTSRTKLSMNEAYEIRTIVFSGVTQAEAARIYNVDPSCVSNIVLNKSWI